MRLLLSVARLPAAPTSLRAPLRGGAARSLRVAAPAASRQRQPEERSQQGPRQLPSAPPIKQSKTTRPRKAAAKVRAPKQPASPPPLDQALSGAASCAAVSKALQQELQWMRRQHPSACCSEAQLMGAVQGMRNVNWVLPRADDSAALRSLLQTAARTLPSLSVASCKQVAAAVLAFSSPDSTDQAAACTLLLQWSLGSEQPEELSGVLQEWVWLGPGGSSYRTSTISTSSSPNLDGNPSGSPVAPDTGTAVASSRHSRARSARAQLQPELLRLLRDREAQPWQVATSLRLWSMLRWPLPRPLSLAASSAFWWHLPRMEARLVAQAVTAVTVGSQHGLSGWKLGTRATQAVQRALLRVLPTAAAPEVADCLLAAPKLLDAEQLAALAPAAEAALLRVLPFMDERQLAAATRACFWGGWRMSDAALAALFAEAAVLDPAAAEQVALLLRAQLLRMLRTHPAALGRGVPPKELEQDRRLLLHCVAAWSQVGELDSQLAAALSQALPRMLTGAPPQQVAAALRICQAAGWAGQLQPGVMQLLALWLSAHSLRGSWLPPPPLRAQRSGLPPQ